MKFLRRAAGIRSGLPHVLREDTDGFASGGALSAALKAGAPLPGRPCSCLPFAGNFSGFSAGRTPRTRAYLFGLRISMKGSAPRKLRMKSVW